MADQMDGKKFDETGAGEAPARLPYKKPKLIELGTLRDLTGSVSNSGNRDGATGANNKTGRGGRFDEAGIGLSRR